MTQGQKRALRELQRLKAVSSQSFEPVHDAYIHESWLIITIGLHLGLMETREGGLDLRDWEEFIIWVPADFPFERPRIKVSHQRFTGFPHVIWGKTICLYQSNIERNPADGMYGFFDRLKLWLQRAAINEMVTTDGPLEPPHHVTDFTHKPIVVRANAPCEAGRSWICLAVLQNFNNRFDLVDW